jgi:hypothetical protein
MMSQKTMNNIRNDVMKVTVLSVVSGYLSGKNLMDQSWQMELAYTLLGFAIYEAVLSKHIPRKMLKEHVEMVEELAKMATMMVTVKVLSARDVNALMDHKWMMASALTLAGFASYHLVTKKLIDTSDRKGDWKQISDDWLKIGTMLVVSHYLSGGDIMDRSFVQESTNTVLGWNMGSLVDYAGGH